MDTLNNQNNEKKLESNQVSIKMRKTFPNENNDVDQVPEENKYVCSTPMQLPINRNLFDLNIVSASPIVNKKSDHFLKTAVSHFEKVNQDNPSISPFPFVYNLPIHKMMMYDSDEERAYESVQSTKKQMQKNMSKNTNKKTKNHTKGSLENKQNLDRSVFTTSPMESKVGQKNKTKILDKINEIVVEQDNVDKHTVKPPSPVKILKRNKKDIKNLLKPPLSVKVLKRNKKDIHSSTIDNDVFLSPSIVEEKVVRMKTRSSKMTNEIIDNQIDIDNNITQSHLAVKTDIHKKINTTEEANNERKVCQYHLDTISNRGSLSSKRNKDILKDQENCNKNETSCSVLKHQNGNITDEIQGDNFNQPTSPTIIDFDKGVSNPQPSEAISLMQNQKINGSPLALRISKKKSHTLKKINQVKDEEEASNKNICQAPLSVLQKHKKKSVSWNRTNKSKCNGIVTDKDMIENASSVKKKILKKKKSIILKENNDIMENRTDFNKDAIQSFLLPCDEVVQKNKMKTSTANITNERRNNQEYADKNSLSLHHSIHDEVLQNNINEPSASKITDLVLNQDKSYKDRLLSYSSVVPNNRTETIASNVAEKESKNRKNISKMQENRVPDKERIEADVLYPDQLDQVTKSSCNSASSSKLITDKPELENRSEDEIINLFDHRETRSAKRKMENDEIGNSKTLTFSERALSKQLPLGNKGQIVLVENGEFKIMKCFGRFPSPENKSISVKTCLHNSLFTAGIIEIQPLTFVGAECSELFGLYCFVLEGTAEVGIGNSSKVLSLGDCYFVPKSTTYYIRNVSLTEKCIINFCKIC